MNLKEVNKWLDDEFGCSYTKLEELHDFYFEKYTDLQQENQQLKEQVEYLRRSCERKEDTIISLEQDLTIIDELEKWCKSFTTEEFNYNFLVVRIKDILDKINELKGVENDK